MNAANRFRAFENLGNAVPFVARILDVIEQVPVLGALTRDEVEALARYLRCYRAPAGVEVIAEGENGDFMLLLIEGEMEITRADSNGFPVPVATVRPGKTVGEMSVIDGEPRFASCVTLTEVVVAVLDRNQLDLMLTDEPPLGAKLLMQLLLLVNQRLRGISNELMKCLEQQRLQQRAD